MQKNSSVIPWVGTNFAVLLKSICLNGLRIKDLFICQDLFHANLLQDLLTYGHDQVAGTRHDGVVDPPLTLVIYIFLSESIKVVDISYFNIALTHYQLYNQLSSLPSYMCVIFQHVSQFY